MTRALTSAELTSLSQAASAWRLSPEVGQRVIESVIGAAELPARLRKGDGVVEVIVGKRWSGPRHALSTPHSRVPGEG